MFQVIDQITDEYGNGKANWQLEVYDLGTGLAVPMFADYAGTIPIEAVSFVANRAVSDRFGNVSSAYVAVGTYGKRYYDAQNVLRRTIPSLDMYGASNATDLASLVTGKGAALVGHNDGAGGTLWTTVTGFIAYLRSSAGSSIMGYLASWTGAVSRTVSSRLSDTVSVKDFGAVGNGTTDDTVALQSFLDYLALNRRFGRIPKGTYRITSPLTTYRTDSWGFAGDGPNITIIQQDTDNVAILDLGSNTSSGSGFMHSTLFEGFTIQHKNAQIGNTAARGIVFSAMVYNGTMRRISFNKSYCGMYVNTGINPPWGNTWDDFIFGGTLTGCAMDWSQGMTIGVPNNDWGRMTVACNGMTKTIFDGLTGSNCRIGAIEFLGNVGTNPAGGTGNQLISFKFGSSFVIDCLKLETFNFTGAQTFFGGCLIFSASGSIQIGDLLFLGTQSVFNSATSFSIFGGSPLKIRVGFLNTGLSQVPANVSVFGVSSGDNEIETYSPDIAARTVPLTNISSSASADVINYGRNSRGRISANIGDANYTLATNGGPNTIIAETALTAPRTVEIMADTYFLFNGYRIKVISRGAVNGANTLVIKAGGNTKATISADNYAVELVWRRNATAHNGWQIVSQGAA